MLLKCLEWEEIQKRTSRIIVSQSRIDAAQTRYNVVVKFSIMWLVLSAGCGASLTAPKSKQTSD